MDAEQRLFGGKTFFVPLHRSLTMNLHKPVSKVYQITITLNESECRIYRSAHNFAFALVHSVSLVFLIPILIA